MSYRVLSVAAVVAVVSLGAVPAGAQTDVPRTPWGQPDLQGTWDFRTITPMERPDELADKAFLTEEEAARLEQEAVDWLAGLWALPPERTEVGGEVGKTFVWARDSGSQTVDTRRTSLVVDPPDGKIPALTADGQRRADARAASQRDERFDSWTDLSLGVRCMMGFNAGPPMTPSAYNNNMQLFQTPDTVVVVTEMIHNARIIPLDGRPHLPSDIRQWSGDSRGHWEGDTLVVETTNYTDKTRWRDSAATLRLVERFTRVDADTLLYQFTAEDPKTWTRPWTAQVTMRRNHLTMQPYECHEGNYSMPGILGGARVKEKAAAEAARK